MDDLKEDLLDTVAIFRERVNNLGVSGLIMMLLPLLLWPFLYFLMAFGLIKLIISGSGAAILTSLLYKKISK
tara:strand:- start:115 stop:330 length:216 start_codon:yes stop_codon:yes gene_type:complete